MASAIEGVLISVWRIGDDRSARCKAEAGSYRNWFAERVVGFKEKLVLDGSALTKRRKLESRADLRIAERAASGAAKTLSAHSSSAEAVIPAAEQAVLILSRQGLPAADGESAKLLPLPPPPPLQWLSQAPARSLAVEQDTLLQSPAVEAGEAADTAAGSLPATWMLAAKDMQQSAQLTLLEAAVHAPLPSPSLPHAVPIGSSAQPGSILLEEAAVAITVPSEAATTKRPAVKLASLQVTEHARRREEQLELERRQKKDELVRQREAARQAALSKGTDVTSKGGSEAQPNAGLSAASKVEPAAALPRLKQMIEAKKLADRLHLEQSAAKSKVAASSQRPAAGQDERHKIEEDLCIVRKELDDLTQSAKPEDVRTAELVVERPVLVGAQLHEDTLAIVGAPAVQGLVTAAAQVPTRPIEILSYEISPYKSGSDSENEDERPRKPVPAWARSDALAPVLYEQAKADPDDIFLNPVKTCSLSDVFQCAGNKKRDFARRGSSGNWEEDQLTKDEEAQFKRRYYGGATAVLH